MAQRYVPRYLIGMVQGEDPNLVVGWVDYDTAYADTQEIASVATEVLRREGWGLSAEQAVEKAVAQAAAQPIN